MADGLLKDLRDAILAEVVTPERKMKRLAQPCSIQRACQPRGGAAVVLVLRNPFLPRQGRPGASPHTARPAKAVGGGPCKAELRGPSHQRSPLRKAQGH